MNVVRVRVDGVEPNYLRREAGWVTGESLPHSRSVKTNSRSFKTNSRSFKTNSRSLKNQHRLKIVRVRPLTQF